MILKVSEIWVLPVYLQHRLPEVINVRVIYIYISRNVDLLSEGIASNRIKIGQGTAEIMRKIDGKTLLIDCYR